MNMEYFLGMSNYEMLECLARCPRADHDALSLVCKRVRSIVRDPAFQAARRRTPLTYMSCLEEAIILVGGRNMQSNGSLHGEGSLLDSRGQWIKIAPVLEPVAGNHLVTAAGEVYSVGGFHGNTMGPPCACMMIYNPVANRWRPGPVWARARTLSLVVAAHDKIFIFGGQDRMMCGNELTACDVYDPALGKWSPIANLPDHGYHRYPCYEGGEPDYAFSDSEDEDFQAPYCHCAGGAVVGDRIYVFGGQFDDQVCTSRVLAYEITTDTWYKCADMPEPRYYAECHAVGTDIICMGGIGNDGPMEDRGLSASKPPIKTAWVYDTVENTWDDLEDSPLPNGDPVVMHGKGTSRKISSLSFNGDGKRGAMSYDVASDTWDEVGAVPGLPQGHAGMCGIATVEF